VDLGNLLFFEPPSPLSLVFAVELALFFRPGGPLRYTAVSPPQDRQANPFSWFRGGSLHFPLGTGQL